MLQLAVLSILKICAVLDTLTALAMSLNLRTDLCLPLQPPCSLMWVSRSFVSVLWDSTPLVDMLTRFLRVHSLRQTCPLCRSLVNGPIISVLSCKPVLDSGASLS